MADKPEHDKLLVSNNLILDPKITTLPDQEYQQEDLEQPERGEYKRYGRSDHSSDEDKQACIEVEQKLKDSNLFVAIRTKSLDALTIIEKIDQCLKNGAQIDARNTQGNTVLHLAVKKRYKEIVKFLLEKRAKINIRNNDNKTPLDYAENNEDFVQILNKSINVPGDGNCLFWATALAYLTCVKNYDGLYQERFKILFGSENHLSEVQTLIQNYNPFIEQDKTLNNSTLNKLITIQFRGEVVKYMRTNPNDFEQSVEGTFKQYLDQMSHPGEWGGEHEIKAMSKMLGCIIQVHSGSIITYGSGNDHIKLYHESLTGDTSSSSNRNHYNFDVDLNIVDDYPRPVSYYAGSDKPFIYSSDQQLTSLKKKSDEENTKNKRRKSDTQFSDRQLTSLKRKSDEENTENKRRKSDTQFSDLNHGKRLHDSNNEGGVSPEKRPNIFSEKPNEYHGSGLKNTLHGNIYQLKLLMLFVRVGVNNNYQFRLATEMDAAEKFDDLVFQCQNVQQNGQDGIVHRFLQAKHKQDESQKITDNDLLSEKDDDFSLQKYFISFRRIKQNPNFQGDLQDFILCTNINLDFVKLKQAQINTKEITEEDVFFRSVKTQKKLASCYKLIVDKQNPLYEKLRETSDVYMLAKTLVKHMKNQKPLNLKNPILKYYHTTLVQEQVIVIEEKSTKNEGTKATKEYIGKFTEKFINYNLKDPNDLNNDPGLSESAKTLRKILQEHLDKIKGLLINKDTELKLSSTFGKGFELDPDPQLTGDIEKFAEEFVTLIVKNTSGKLVTIDGTIYRKNAKLGSNAKAVADNIDKLAGHVLISKDEKIQFRESFFDDSDSDKLPDDLNKFKTSLKSELQKHCLSLNYLSQYQFKIGGGFKTCEEDLLGAQTDLPNDKIEDEEISEFFEKLVFAVGQPNEVELGDILKHEMGEDNQFNLLNADLVTDSFLRNMLDWFKAKGLRGKEGTWFSEKTAENLFKSLGELVNTLVTVGLSSTYPEKLKRYGVEFKSENQGLKDFLSTNNSTQIFNLVASTETLLSALKVYQTLKLGHLSKTYKQQDSYIFMRARTILRPKIQKMVMDAFESTTSHHLLVLDCDPVRREQDLQDLFSKLSKIINNPRKKIILITNQNNALENQFSIDYKYTTEKDDSNFKDLTPESQNKGLEKKVMFQGKNIMLNKLIGQSDENAKQTIDSATLVKLIRNEEINIGSKLNDLGKIHEYYITRMFNGQVILNKAKIKQVIKSYLISDFFVISGTDSGLAGMHNKIYVFDNDELAGNKFLKLCEQNKGSNIHWLKSESGKLIWYHSEGSISNLVKYRETDKVDDSTDDKTSNKCLIEEKYLEGNKSKIVIIADTAGMGKSTVLTSLSVKIKDDNPSLWVIRIDLNEYTTVLNRELKNRKSNKPSFSNQDVNSVVNFLLDTLLESGKSKLKTNLEKELFKNSVNGQGKIALLFDGFDEISPEYQDVVIDILQALKKSKVEKLFVTTRPNMRELLEEKLEVFSVLLKPFDYQDQIIFLTKFWTKELELKDLNQEHEEQLNIYAESLIKKFSTSINDREQKFIGVPLQTMMLAKIFQENTEGIQKEWDGCKEFLTADHMHKNPKLPEKFDLLGLYEKFVERKYYEFYLQGKKGRDLTKSGEGRLADENYENFKKRHETLALSALFSDKDLKELFPPPEIQQLNDWIQQNRIQNYEGKNFEKNKGEHFERNEGFIKIIDQKPHFIHRTFTEYFASFALVEKMHLNPKLICSLVNSLVANASPVFISSLAETLNIKEVRIECLLIQEHFERNEGFIKIIDQKPNFFYRTFAEYFASFPLVEMMHLNHESICSLVNSLVANASPVFNNSIAEILNKKNVRIESYSILAFITKEFRFYLKFFNALLEMDYQDDLGQTSLHYAVQYNCKDTMEYVLTYKQGILGNNIMKHGNFINKEIENSNLVKFVNKKDNKGNTALDHAEHCNSDLMLSFKLLLNGANIDRLKQKYLKKLTHYMLYTKSSLSWGNDSYIFDDNILEAYANQENKFRPIQEKLLMASPQIFNPLHKHYQSRLLSYFFVHGRVKVIDTLLNTLNDEENKRRLLNANDNHATPLDRVNYSDQLSDDDRLEITKYLVENGSKEITAIETMSFSSDYYITIILHAAAENGHIKTFQHFIGQEKHNKYVAYFYAAARNQHFNIIKYLYEKHQEHLKVNGNIVLHSAVDSGASLEIIKYCIDNGDGINAKNDKGETPLILAIYASRKLNIIKYLVDHGANVNIADKEGKTAAYYAVKKDQQDIIKYLLLERKAEINFTYEMEGNKVKLIVKNPTEFNCALFQLGVKSKDLNWTKCIIQQGADIKNKDKHGKMPLHWASELQQTKIVELLLQHGAIFDARDINNRTPLDLLLLGKMHLHLVSPRLPTKIVELLDGARDINNSSPLNLLSQPYNDDISWLLGVLNKLFTSHNLIQDLQLILKARYMFNYREPYDPYFVDVWDDDNPMLFILNARNAEEKTLLHIAADTNDQQAIKILLQFNHGYLERKTKPQRNSRYKDYQSISIDAIDFQKNTPLHLAAQKGHNQMVSLLLAKGAIFNSENLQGKTPAALAKNNNHDNITELMQPTKSLFIAMKQKSLAKVKNCIKEGAYINAKDKNGKTPLHWAASFDQTDVVQFLLKKKANIEAIDTHNRTPLHFATENNKLETVKLLLKNGAIFDAKDTDDKSPFEIEKNQSVNLLEAINKLFNDIQSDNPQVSIDYLEMVHREYEIDISTVINIRDNQGNTILHYAAESNDFNIVKFLLENGAMFDAKNKLKKTAKDIATRQDIIVLLESIEEMFKNFNNIYQEKNVQIIINVRNDQRKTLLHMAAGKLNIVQWLVELGGDVKAVDQHGNTVLDDAANKGNWDTVEFLVGKIEPDVNAVDEKGNTVLHIAANNGKCNLVKFLVETTGADVNAVDEDGNTVLHIIANSDKWDLVNDNSFISVVEYLLMPKADNGAGADITLKNFSRDTTLEGYTALDIAKKRGYQPLVTLLKQASLESITADTILKQS